MRKPIGVFPFPLFPPLLKRTFKHISTVYEEKSLKITVFNTKLWVSVEKPEWVARVILPWWIDMLKTKPTSRRFYRKILTFPANFRILVRQTRRYG